MKAKRLISMLLLVVLLLGMLPMQAFAASELIFTAIEGGYQYNLYSSGAMNVYQVNKEDNGNSYWTVKDQVTKLVFKDGVTEIPSVFSYTYNLTTITMANSVTSIAPSAFEGCSNLTSITSSSNLKSIGDYAFYNCDSLTKFSTSNNVTSIGNYAFGSCNSLQSVTLPSKLKTIGEGAFEYCNALTSIVIPSKVTSIGNYAFADCYSLDYIYFDGNAPTMFDNTFGWVTAHAYFPKGNSTWNSGNRLNYGANSLTWHSISQLDEPSIWSDGNWYSGKPAIYWEANSRTNVYYIYRSTKKTSGFKKIDTYYTDWYNDTIWYEDYTAKAGTRYFYKVKAITPGASKYYSDYSNVVDRCCDLPVPEVELTNGSTGYTKLTWGKVSGAAKYYIYRRTTSGSFKKIGATTGTSFTDKDAAVGTQYYYAVKAIHGSNSSANSDYSEAWWGVRCLARPNVTATVSNGDPKLSWAKISGATKYQVYRALTKNGEYDLVKTVTGTSFTDTTAKAGTTYYYKVVAVSSKAYANSIPSSVDSAKAS